MTASPAPRRPIKARETRWAAAAASALAKCGVRPNVISVTSVVFAGIAGLCLANTPLRTPGTTIALLVAAALGIQGRLLCNLFDGMVAVEGGFKTKSGELFNELPDRFADAFVLIGCGYGAISRLHGAELGWSAAVLAVITAYVRTLGAAIGAGHNFTGPMAKQHRMATVTVACLAAALAEAVPAARDVVTAGSVLWAALVVITLGEIITIARRARWIVRTLEAK
jgi:phosphatidylglycerophosphate synthase